MEKRLNSIWKLEKLSKEHLQNRKNIGSNRYDNHANHRKNQLWRHADRATFSQLEEDQGQVVARTGRGRVERSHYDGLWWKGLDLRCASRHQVHSACRRH